jgi:hypothetical protein
MRSPVRRVCSERVRVDPASGANNPIAVGPQRSVGSTETVPLSESGETGTSCRWGPARIALPSGGVAGPTRI